MTSDVSTTDDGPTATELLDHLATRLAPYELPTDIRMVDVLPRTDSGKVDLLGVRAAFERAGA